MVQSVVQLWVGITIKQNLGRIDKAIPLANKAASIAVSHTGTYILTQEDVDGICKN